MKRAVWKLAVIFAALLLAAGCGGKEAGKEAPKGDAKSAGEKIVIRFAGTMPVNHHITTAGERYKKAVEEATKGRVEIQFYPAQQLYADKDLVSVVPKGGVEMAQVNFAFWTGLAPSLGLLSMGVNYSGADHYFRVQDGEPGKIIAKDLEEKANIKFISWLDYGMGTFIANKPLKTINDFKGTKLRGQGDYDSAFIKDLGGAPTAMSSTEVYMALQRGVLDGAISGPSSFVTRKWIEVAKYPVNIDIGRGQFGIVANRDFFNKLPADIQKVLLEEARKVCEWTRQEAKNEDSKAWETIRKTPGVQVVEVSPDEFARWRELGVKGGKEILSEKIGKEKAAQLLDMVEKLRK